MNSNRICIIANTSNITHKYILLRIICIIRVSSFCCFCSGGWMHKAILWKLFEPLAYPLMLPWKTLHKKIELNKLWVMDEKENLFDNEWFMWWCKTCIKETEVVYRVIASNLWALIFTLTRSDAKHDEMNPPVSNCRISRKICCSAMFV